MSRKVYVGVPNFAKVTLPSGYTQVEYIQTSGTQAIDTRFKPNQNTKVEIVYRCSGTSKNALFACDTEWQNNGFAVGMNFAEFGNAVETGISLSGTDNTTVIFDKGKLYKNGTLLCTITGTFQTNYNLYLLAFNRSGTIGEFFTGTFLSCKIWDNGTLIRDYITCKNVSGVIGLYDLVEGKFYTNAGTGTFTAGATQKSVARKVKQIYVGVESKARRVKKAYIGIGGVARPFWGDYKLSYYGGVTSLSNAPRLLAGASVGNCALFAGGITSSAPVKTVDTYNQSLTKSTATDLTNAKYSMGGVTIGNHALFAGGGLSSGTTASSDAYNKDLTKSTAPTLSNARSEPAVATVGNYALIAGGLNSNSTELDSVETYNTSLTKSYATALSRTVWAATGCSVGDYALIAFAGVDAYDSSLTKTTTTAPTNYMAWGSATQLGDYAIFFAGAYPNYYKTVDAYNKSLTQVKLADMSVARNTHVAMTLQGFAMVCCGRTSSGFSEAVDIYDKSLTRSTGTSFGTARYYCAGAVAGNYALVAGGQKFNAYGVNTVQAYVAQ